MRRADVLVTTLSDRVDADALGQAGDRLKLIARQRAQEALGHRDVRARDVVARREQVFGVDRVGDPERGHPDPAVMEPFSFSITDFDVEWMTEATSLLSGPAVDFIATNIAGCGALLREYDFLLRDDPEYAERAKEFAKKVRDISEVLLHLSGYIGLPSVREAMLTANWWDAAGGAHRGHVAGQLREETGTQRRHAGRVADGAGGHAVVPGGCRPDVDLLVVGPGVKTGIPIRYDDPREVGPDRIANSVAANSARSPPLRLNLPNVWAPVR